MASSSVSDEHKANPIEFAFDESSLESCATLVKNWCLVNGLVLLNKSQPDQGSANSLPVTLFPTRFPRNEFDYAMKIQNDFNILVNSVANDYNLLRDSLKDVVLVDDFTKRLWEICETVNREGVAQPITLGLLRNDYILDQNKSSSGKTQLSQVEINTVSCSFGSATSQVNKLHKYILRATENKSMLDKHANNDNLQNIATGLAQAWNLYGNSKALVVFIVTEDERNIGDQRLLEYKCIDVEPDLRIKRLTLSQIHQSAKLDADKRLILNDKEEVGLVYYRAGYDPSHYNNEDDWQARLLIEKSKAIKCPNINYHLAGCKKIQQVLFENESLANRYLKDEKIVQKIRDTFVEQYSFGDADKNEEIIKMMLEKPEQFVLKPQREGGGHNVYKSDIKTFYENLADKSDLKGYILMKLIKPYLNQNLIVKPLSAVIKDDLISEMGVFGVIIAKGNSVLLNESTGYLLRSKSFNVNEGGVASGYSALDSIYLTD